MEGLRKKSKNKTPKLTRKAVMRKGISRQPLFDVFLISE
jgi:hypothetical protein